MEIDLDSSNGRKEYLKEKLDDLLGGINESYGMVLMQELLDRLEITIKDFNDEVKILCDQLVKKQEERQNLLEMLTADGENTFKMNDAEILNEESSTGNDADDNAAAVTATAWEKKLSKLEKK